MLIQRQCFRKCFFRSVTGSGNPTNRKTRKPYSLPRLMRVITVTGYKEVWARAQRGRRGDVPLGNAPYPYSTLGRPGCHPQGWQPRSLISPFPVGGIIILLCRVHYRL